MTVKNNPGSKPILSTEDPRDAEIDSGLFIERRRLDINKKAADEENRLFDAHWVTL